MDEEQRVSGDHLDVVALALGDVDGGERGRMAAHLVACRACRDDYDDLTATVGDLLAAVPAVQPPLGFEERVLAQLRAAAAAPAPRRLRWLGVAAAVVVAVVASFVAGAALHGSSQRAAAVSPLEVTGTSEPVGSVSLSDVDGRTVMVVAIVGPSTGVSYRCRTTLADGTTVESAPWPSGEAAWLVPLPGASVADVRTVTLVVDGTEDVWSSASF
jgi:hypothetical protein